MNKAYRIILLGRISISIARASTFIGLFLLFGCSS
ncbi:uncharacterized protein METZ01_LOCUS84967, partial [marine metagenome]